MIHFDMVIGRCVGKTHNFSDFCSNIFMQNKIREGIPVGELVKEEQENNPNISTAVAQERISETDSTNIWWLSCALYHECRVLDDEAQIAVASVIMNRVKSDKFPNTIFEVLVQPGQYAFVNDEIIWGEPDERAIKMPNMFIGMVRKFQRMFYFRRNFYKDLEYGNKLIINIFVMNK